MTEQDALENLHGLLCSYDNRPFSKLDHFISLQVLREWKQDQGQNTFEALVDLMARGQTITSPISTVFRYKAGSLAGRQLSLPGIT